MIPKNQKRRSDVQRSYIVEDSTESNRTRNRSNPTIIYPSDISSMPPKNLERSRTKDDDRYNRERRHTDRKYIFIFDEKDDSSNTKKILREYVSPISEEHYESEKNTDKKTEKSNIPPSQAGMNSDNRKKQRVYINPTTEEYHDNEKYKEKKTEKTNVIQSDQVNENSDCIIF